MERSEGRRLKEYEEHINPMPKHGVNQYNKGGYISPPKIDKGNSRQYQIQRLKRDAPGKY